MRYVVPITSSVALGMVALILVVFVGGCSPRYDWRTVTLGDEQVQVMFPDKPQSTEREFDFEGHALTFVLTSASVDDALFTVGYVALPDALLNDAAGHERLVQQVQTSLYHNLGATAPEQLAAAGERFTITGQGQGKELRLEAMMWTTSHAFIEGIVVSEAGSWPSEQIKEFFRELAPDLRPAPG